EPWMSPPALATRPPEGAAEKDVAEPPARLNQPSRQQTALAISRAAVALADRLRFGRKVDGFPGTRRRDHAQRLGNLLVNPASLRRELEHLRLPVDQAQDLAPVLQAVEREVGGEA